MRSTCRLSTRDKMQRQAKEIQSVPCPFSSFYWERRGDSACMVRDLKRNSLFPRLRDRKFENFRISMRTTMHTCLFFVVPPTVLLPAVVVRSLPGYRVWCSATGSPPIHIALLRNFTVLANTTATLKIRLYHEGNYTCAVTSKYGTNRSDFSVTFSGESLV